MCVGVGGGGEDEQFKNKVAKPELSSLFVT